MIKKSKKDKSIFEGKKCEICNRKYGKEKGQVGLVRHHMTYDPPELCYICFSCHWWVHGTRAIYNHPFIREYGKDGGANMFHVKYAQLVEKYTGSRT